MARRHIVILAAGAARRFPPGTCKHTLDVHGTPLLSRTLNVIMTRYPYYNLSIIVNDSHPLAGRTFTRVITTNHICESILKSAPDWAPDDMTYIIHGDVIWKPSTLAMFLAWSDSWRIGRGGVTPAGKDLAPDQYEEYGLAIHPRHKAVLKDACLDRLGKQPSKLWEHLNEICASGVPLELCDSYDGITDDIDAPCNLVAFHQNVRWPEALAP